MLYLLLHCNSSVSRYTTRTLLINEVECLIMTMTMTIKYIYLNPTLYIQWIVNIACKVPNSVKILLM